MRRNFLNLFVAVAAITVILSAVEVGSAQRREARGRMMTKGQVQVVIDRLEDRMDKFTGEFDKSLDNSKLNGTNREDTLNRRAKDLEAATDRLRSEFSRHDAWIDNKEQVRACLRIASDINKSMRNRHFGNATESNWANVRNELNTLADIYNLPRVASGAY